MLFKENRELFSSSIAFRILAREESQLNNFFSNSFPTNFSFQETLVNDILKLEEENKKFLKNNRNKRILLQEFVTTFKIETFNRDEMTLVV